MLIIKDGSFRAIMEEIINLMHGEHKEEVNQRIMGSNVAFAIR